MASPSLFIVSIAAAFLLTLHIWITARQPFPYMDELFHIPQAQSFCTTVRTGQRPVYNPSITTLPGLYLPPALLCLLLPTLSTRTLRIFSLLATILSLPLLSLLLRHLRHRARLSSHPSFHQSVAALALWLHPVSLFYAYLFYTDAPATLYTLFSWYLSLSNCHVTSAAVGLFAAFTRQTHLVWHLYVALDAALYILALRPAITADTIPATLRALSPLWPHAAAAALYAVLLTVNNGPTVGDHAHHEMSLHYAMLPYFCGFHAVSFALLQLVSPTHFFRQARMLVQSPRYFAGFVAACAAMAALVIATGVRVHPFILADNRHYTFYVYKRWLLRSSWRRLCLVPLYAWGLVSPCLELRLEEGEHMQRETKKDSSGGWAQRMQLVERTGDIALFCCAAIALVPSPLMEPRYFVVASLLLSLRRFSRQRVPMTTRGLMVLCGFLFCVNVLFVYVFAEMPFERPVDPHMPHDTSPGRFMF